MDLIYANEKREDVNVLKDYSLDLAYGVDENDFECRVSIDNHCCDTAYFLYVEGTEYGGIVDNIKVDTENAEITYSGRTWHGILESKIITPETGEDYLVLTGEGNAVLASLVERMGLLDLFCVSEADSGVKVKSYKMNRYIGGYTGIRKMLRASGAKLHMTFKNGMVELSTAPLVDYSQDEQFDSDQIGFVVTKHSAPINHVICLGKGELAEREVIHLFADESGNVVESQVFFGLSEVAAVYDYANAESTEELVEGGGEIIRESWNADEVTADFGSDDAVYDIGDIVGAKERITGVEVAVDITKKIVTTNGIDLNIRYKVGE